MKYVITSTGQVGTDKTSHQNAVRGLRGKVVAAGYYSVISGRICVYGRSTHFGVESHPSDADVLEDYFFRTHKKWAIGSAIAAFIGLIGFILASCYLLSLVF